MTTAARRALRGLAAPACVVCGVEQGDPVCPGCLADYFPVATPRCAVCGVRLPSVAHIARCGRCLHHPPHFSATLVLADYAPPVDGMVMALKYHGRLDLAEAFGRLLALRAAWVQFDAVLAVPLAPARLRERGYNQAQDIARALARCLHRPLLSDALQRVRAGPPQQGLRLAQRRRNLHGAFAAPRPLALRHVLLVDDVLTTGSTLDEAAGCLRRAGVGRVSAAVAARTP